MNQGELWCSSPSHAIHPLEKLVAPTAMITEFLGPPLLSLVQLLPFVLCHMHEPHFPQAREESLEWGTP